MKSAATFKYLLCLAFIGILCHFSISLYAQASEDTSQRQAEKFKMKTGKIPNTFNTFFVKIINTQNHKTVETWKRPNPYIKRKSVFKLTDKLFLIQDTTGGNTYYMFNAEKKQRLLSNTKLKLDKNITSHTKTLALNCIGLCPFKTINLRESVYNTFLFKGHNDKYGLFDHNLDTLLSPKYEWIKDSKYPNLVIVEKDSTNFVYDVKARKKISKIYKVLRSLDDIESYQRAQECKIKGYAPIKGFITEDGILDLNGKLQFSAKNGCIRFYDKYFTVKKVDTNQINLYTYDFEKINDHLFLGYQHINDTLGTALTKDLSARFFHIPGKKLGEQEFKYLKQLYGNKMIYSKAKRPGKYTILGKKIAEKVGFFPNLCDKYQMPEITPDIQGIGTKIWIQLAKKGKLIPALEINRNMEYGVVNLKGETLLEAKYADIIAERNGYAVKKNKEWTILDEEFRPVETGIKDFDKMWDMLHE